MATEVEPQMATQQTGNTKTVCSKRRDWQLTLNDIDRWHELSTYLLEQKSLLYIIACEELAPSTGHKHIHCYCHFKTPRVLSIKKMCGAHIEPCNGSPKQNIAYIRKDGNIILEQGDEPSQGARSVKELKETTNPDNLPWQSYNTWKKIHDETANDIDIDDWRKNVNVYYIQGPSGIGKTESAKDIVRKNKETYGSKVNIVKYENGFWSGIGTAKICIYDDFRSSHMKASEFINFIDYNKHTMNIKGGQHINTYELIIITSVEPLQEIYKNMIGEPRLQWERRVEVIDMTPDNNNDIEFI